MGNEKKVKLEASVIVEPLLTASRIELSLAARFGIIRNHRAESRSYRTCGWAIDRPPETEAQNAASARLSASVTGGTAVLLNVLIRPLTATRSCVGPTASMLSGVGL